MHNRQQLSIEQLQFLKQIFIEFNGQINEKCFEKISQKLPFYLVPTKKQLEVIFDSFKNNLPLECIQKYARTDFSADKMQQILLCFIENIPSELIEILISLKYRYEIEKFKFLFEKGMTIPQIQNLVSVDIYCISLIYRSLEDKNLSVEQVSVFAKPEFNYNQMEQILEGFENGLTMEQILFYAKPDFDAEQMKQIKLGFKNGLSIEQVSVYANPKFDWFQMESIRLGFKNGLSMEQVLVYAKPEFRQEQMKQMRLGFENGLSIEQVQVYANPIFTEEQMEEIRLGLENGLSVEQVMIYAKPEFQYTEMKILRTLLQKNFINENNISFIMNNIDKIRIIEKCVEDGLTEEQIKFYTQNYNELFLKNSYKNISKLFKLNFSFDIIKNIAKLYEDKFIEKLIYIAEKYSTKHALLCVNNISPSFKINILDKIIFALDNLDTLLQKQNNETTLTPEQQNKITYQILEEILTKKFKQLKPSLSYTASIPFIEKLTSDCLKAFYENQISNIFGNLNTVSKKTQQISTKSFKI